MRGRTNHPAGVCSDRIRQQVLPIAALGQWACQCFELGGRDVVHPLRDLFRTCDLESLPLLDDRDELRRFEQRFVRAGVEPCGAAAERHDSSWPISR